ncbi:MAG: hypothetical protein HZA78_10330 [Candidatus Schekmanbacteria bacterium]|nr:hypothetical protein [Candidatus Schekmanbacteria bacterium]
MSKTIEEITINYEEDGELLVKELEKEVLTKGAWTTIMFLYQDLDRKTKEYGARQISIRRYRKMNGEYRQQSKFNISSEKQAKQIVDIINKWC